MDHPVLESFNRKLQSESCQCASDNLQLNWIWIYSCVAEIYFVTIHLGIHSRLLRLLSSPYFLLCKLRYSRPPCSGSGGRCSSCWGWAPSAPAARTGRGCRPGRPRPPCKPPAPQWSSSPPSRSARRCRQPAGSNSREFSCFAPRLRESGAQLIDWIISR